MKIQVYSDSDPLYTILKGYTEATRMLMFHSTELEADKLQEALDIIKSYNEFDSKRVGKVLLEKFGDNCEYIVGRENSVVVYVVPKSNWAFTVEDMAEVSEEALVDEVSVDKTGRLRLWWD